MNSRTETVRAVIVGILVAWVLAVGAKDAMGLPSCSFPAIYNFGDSNSDTGGISAAFLPINAPYGENFFHKPAGRDSDGRVIVDFIGKFKSGFGLKFNCFIFP